MMFSHCANYGKCSHLFKYHLREDLPNCNSVTCLQFSSFAFTVDDRLFVALLMLCAIKCTSFSVFVLAIVLQFLNEVFVASTKREAIVAKKLNQQQISTIMLCC